MSRDKSKETTRCRSMKGDGSRCPNHTRDSSGLCPSHRDGQDFFSEGFLKCDNCVVPQCEFRDKGIKGFCYYEITDKITDLDSKMRLVEGMRRTISMEMRIVGRLERSLNLMKCDNEDYNSTVQLLMHVNDQLNRHLQSYGKFLGWQSDTSSASQKEERLKLLQGIFKNDGKDKQLESITAPTVELEDIEQDKQEADSEEVENAKGDNGKA